VPGKHRGHVVALWRQLGGLVKIPTCVCVGIGRLWDLKRRRVVFNFHLLRSLDFGREEAGVLESLDDGLSGGVFNVE
jgi:hypothetical protein